MRLIPPRLHGLVTAALLLSAFFGNVAAWAAPTQPPQHTLEAADFAGLRGDYRLPSGELALLGGWPAHGRWTQRLFLEVDGVRRPLRAVASDRFVTADGDTLRVVRDADGVRGLELTGADGAANGLAERLALYSEQDVAFTSHGITLAGTLLLPPGAGPHPAVVLVHGAGADGREPYRSLADFFARHGIAALIYDKRGVADSAGDWQLASFEDLADDAIAAAQLLRTRPKIDPARVGLWGISQGGWITPIAAARSADIAFIIPVSGSGVSPARQELWRIGNNLRYRELSPAAIAIGLKGNQMLYSLKPLAQRGWISLPPTLWFRALDLWLDPSAIWQRVRQPVLAIWGETDGLVPTPESVEVVKTALDRGGNAHYTLRVFGAADHGLLQAVEGFQNEQRPRVAYVDGYREAMAQWISGLPHGADGRQVILPATATPTRLAWHGSAREPTPWFGQAIVQLPLLLGFVLLFVWLAVGVPIARLIRRWRSRPHAPSPSLCRARLLAGSAAALGLVALAGWGATLVPTLLEGGDPFLAGHPLSLVVARVAAVGAALAFAGLGVVVAGLRRAQAFTRLGYAAAVFAGLVFIRWAWYWQLFPGL